MRKIVSLVLTLALVCSAVSLFSVSSFSAAKDEFGYDCVAYAKARFREIWGFDLHATGLNEYGVYGASGYYHNASNNGDTISNTPQTGALAVWGGSDVQKYGHVAIVESVSGSNVTYSEGGYDGHFNQETRNTSSMSKTNQPFLGYVYIKGTCDVVSKPVDLGDDFFAVIYNKDTNIPIWCEYTGNVVMGIENRTGSNQLWHFDRQSDGSYVISSAETGKAIEMYNGDTTSGNKVVAASTYWGGNYQKWNIYSQNGGYVFVSKHYPEKNLVLDMYNGDSSSGTSVITWPRKNSSNQIWGINKGNDVQLGTPGLSVKISDNRVNFYLDNNLHGETYYRVKAWKDKIGNGDPCFAKDEINEPYSGSIADGIFPAGTYQAYIEAYNYYQTKRSSIVTFTVTNNEEYTVYFDAKGGTVSPTSISVMSGNKIETLPIPKKTIELTYDSNGGFSSPIAQIDSLKIMHWTDNISMYSINHSCTPTRKETVLYAEYYKGYFTLNSEIPKRNGYAFLGWSTDKNATEPEYSAGEEIRSDKDITLYAVWKEDASCVVNIQGNITSFGDECVKIAFIKEDGQVMEKITTLQDNYAVDKLEPGKYTINVSKPNNVTREYTIEINEETKNLDIQLNLLGDINGDGKVNTMDVARANACAKGVNTLTGYDFECADINGDGKVNTMDVARMNAHAKGVSTLW